LFPLNSVVLLNNAKYQAVGRVTDAVLNSQSKAICCPKYGPKLLRPLKVRENESRVYGIPLSAVTLADKVPYASKLPPLDASKIPKCVAVAQLPPEGVNVGEVESVIAPVLGALNATDCLAYPLPESSVPPPVSSGAAENKATYHAVGRVTESALNIKFNTRFSAWFVRFDIAAYF
jgi:hypothetical protein